VAPLSADYGARIMVLVRRAGRTIH